MTGDQLYDAIKALLSERRTPENLYLMTRLVIRVHLQEPIHQPTVFRWKRTV